MKFRVNTGFTLIEALLVIAIVSVLTTISISYLRPNANMAKAHDVQRRADVRTLLNAIHQYGVDNHGNFPACIDALLRNICVEADCSGVSQSCNLYSIVGAYIVSIPVDPSGANGNDSKYDVQMQNGRITVIAPEAQQTSLIKATR